MVAFAVFVAVTLTIEDDECNVVCPVDGRVVVVGVGSGALSVAADGAVA